MINIEEINKYNENINYQFIKNFFPLDEDDKELLSNYLNDISKRKKKQI